MPRWHFMLCYAILLRNAIGFPLQIVLCHPVICSIAMLCYVMLYHMFSELELTLCLCQSMLCYSMLG